MQLVPRKLDPHHPESKQFDVSKGRASGPVLGAAVAVRCNCCGVCGRCRCRAVCGSVGGMVNWCGVVAVVYLRGVVVLVYVNGVGAVGYFEQCMQAV